MLHPQMSHCRICHSLHQMSQKSVVYVTPTSYVTYYLFISEKGGVVYVTQIALYVTLLYMSQLSVTYVTSVFRYHKYLIAVYMFTPFMPFDVYISVYPTTQVKR